MVASMIPVLLTPMINQAITIVANQCDCGFTRQIKGDIDYLRHTLMEIQGILPEAEEMQVVNIQIRHWLRMLVDIGYEARDVLDELVTISATTSGRYSSLPFYLLHRIVGSRGSSNVPVVLSRPLQRRLSNEVKNVRKRLDELAKQTKIVEQFRSMGGGSRSIPIRRRPETDPFVNKQRDLFVGRTDVKKGIMEKLLNHNYNRVQIVPIWGMGGVGKTTLALNIYNDGRITEEKYPSKNRRWLWVGEKKFSAKEIISKIIDESGTNDVEFFRRKLIEKFKGDRFLIVLDDIWDIDRSEWKLLWDPLTNVGKGGLIIVTTRIRNVIATINTPVPDELRSLSFDDCWQIFESHAFINENSCSDLELKKSIGKQIVHKLEGLPLAAKVVGCSLSNEYDVHIWKNFLDNHESMRISTKDDDVMRTLKLSYDRLPPHLRQCFAYCSVFPKGHVFHEKMLVQMWMAHGFTQSKEYYGHRRPEEIGTMYFKELVNASLFQYVDDKYIMNNMIHDLAELVSDKEYYSLNNIRTRASFSSSQVEKVRHISLTDDIRYLNNLRLCNTKRVLTLYTLHDPKPDILQPEITSLPNSFVRKNIILHDIFTLKRLRVLVLVSNKITHIPDCLSELIHLRYLDICKTRVRKLPDSLCDVYNLQTLIVKPSRTVLPKNVWKMVNLRHLRACLTSCNGVQNLTSLQELYSIKVPKNGKMRELGYISQVRGNLIIKGLENVTSGNDAAEARLHEKTHIDRLELIFKTSSTKIRIQEEVLVALMCPANLTYLKIVGYSGLQSPRWMADGELLRHLESLSLFACHQLKLLPPLGELYSLRRLNISKMNAIRRLGHHFYGKGFNEKEFFPSLETLTLSNIENLKKWDGIVINDSSVIFFPKLRELFVTKCPKLLSVLPHVKICTSNMNVMRSLSKLEISYCDGLVVLELGILVSLKHLEITGCSNLTHVRSDVHAAATVEGLFSLKKLVISNCKKLISIPHLVAIEDLDVNHCEKLRSLNISCVRGLISLQNLEVESCPMLKEVFEDARTSSSSLPPSRLQFLDIDNKLVFSKLFEHDLASLKRMSITGLN